MAHNLNETEEAAIKRIIAKGVNDVNSLTDADKRFLRARSAYIGRKEKEVLKDVIAESRSERKEREKEEAQAAKAKEAASKQSQEDQNAHLKTEDDLKLG